LSRNELVYFFTTIYFIISEWRGLGNVTQAYRRTDPGTEHLQIDNIKLASHERYLHYCYVAI